MNLTQRIEDRLAENKTSIKTFKAYDTAVQRADAIVERAKAWAESAADMDYVIVYLPSTDRWTAVFMFSSFMARTKSGGYIGWISDDGFMSV